MPKLEQYEPTLAVTSLAGKLSKAMADCLRGEGQSASDNLEAALLCVGIMARTTRLEKTADELVGMAGAVARLRELTEANPDGMAVNTPTAGAILDPSGRPMQSKQCKGIDLGDGNFSGCDQSAGDCPECGK